MRIGELIHSGVTAVCGYKLNSAAFKQIVYYECITTADIVLTQQIDPVFTVTPAVIQSYYMFENLVIGNMVPCRLTDPFVTFTGKNRIRCSLRISLSSLWLRHEHHHR